GLRADSVTSPAEATVLAAFYDELNEQHGRIQQLVISAPALSSADGVAVVKAALVIVPVPPAADTTAAPEGLVVLPTFSGQVAQTFPLGQSASLTLGGTATDTPLELFVRPSGVDAAVSVANVQAELAARLDVAPAKPMIIVGEATGSRLELHKAHIRLG